ncbi:MAG: tyrosine-type recombinase/integrase [Solirubrobacterales bacterium]|nr:tyrosine-type recombinase/integrase [Solirubrobacterales bacterium]
MALRAQNLRGPSVRATRRRPGRGDGAGAPRQGQPLAHRGLDEQTTALLARWIDRRRGLAGESGRGPGARAAIFCTLAGGRIHSSYVRRLLPRLAARAGVDKRVHAHGLRHTHAAELAREGTPINVIRDDLGHTSLAVTDRYLRDVAPQAVIDTLKARRWDGA